MGSGDTLGRAGSLFGAIAIVTLVQGYAQPEGVENPTGLEIAAALGATVWFMNNKRVALGRAAALSFGALVLGSIVVVLCKAGCAWTSFLSLESLLLLP